MAIRLQIDGMVIESEMDFTSMDDIVLTLGLALYEAFGGARVDTGSLTVASSVELNDRTPENVTIN